MLRSISKKQFLKQKGRPKPQDVEYIKNKLSEKFNELESYFVVNSMPLNEIKLSRSNINEISKEEFYSFPKEIFKYK